MKSVIVQLLMEQPVLLVQALKPEGVELGDGLWMQAEHHLHVMDDSDFGYSASCPADAVEFHFKLEGRDIGGVDSEFGGCIMRDIESRYELPEEDADISLQVAVVERLSQLFPKYFAKWQTERLQGSDASGDLQQLQPSAQLRELR